MSSLTVAPTSVSRWPEWLLPRADLLCVAGAASAAAGAIHAAAMGVHNEHRQAVLTFAAAATFQLAWGVLAVARRGRTAAVVGMLGSLALVAGWVFAKTTGISFIDGLEEREAIGLPDGLAAAFAGVAASLALLEVRRADDRRPSLRRRLGVTVACLALVGLAFPGMTAAATPTGHHGPATSATTTAAASRTSAVAPVPYDPTKPIDLGGVPGVTPAQQARAENLLSTTLTHLPKFADPAVAVAAGYKSINDGGTGYEHYINGAYRNDGAVLDPDRPESLVYQRRGASRELVAAMYMAEPGTTLDTTPDLGGALTQWHIHDNLCFRATGDVAGLTNADGSCAPGLIKPEAVPMIHVWIKKHRCGPFAALDGIAGGSVKPGEAKACDAAHGH